MDQDPNTPARAWQPTAPQSERRTGSWSRNGGGSEHLTEVSAVSDALGIEIHPSASYASLDPATSSPYTSPAQAPRPDRPLLSSPRSVTSARFHRRASSTQYAAVPGDMGAVDEQRPSPAASQVRFVSEKPEVEQQQQQQQHHHASENKNNPFAFEQVDLGTGQYDGARDGQRGNPVEGMYATGGYAPAAPPGPYNYPNSGFSQSTGFADAHFMDTYHDRVTRNCLSTAEVERRPSDGWPITVLLLSLYSTCASVAWLVIACLKPTWKFVGSGPGAFEPANATMVSALIAKTIEISFITVFVTFLGQVISRRALSGRSQGVTLAELTLRNMVIQPGTLFTRNDSVRYTARTILGLIAMLATLGATFYTTASDAMVSPKLAFGSWGQRSLTGQIAASYANPNYMKQQCKTPVRSDDDKSGDSCLDVHFSGTSYHNLMEFMGAWEIISSNGSNLAQHLGSRPRGTANLFPNTTLVSAWIETDKGNISREFEKHSLIINEVTLAMPHPGVYFAATDPLNGIPQPKDLGGVGEYSLRASVVSPAVNVKCVDMSKKDLAPLVYTEWPYADAVKTGVGNQTMGNTTWTEGVPSLSDDEYYNTTVVDGLFLWGKEHGRRPPIFRMFPADYNIVTNATPALWAQKAMYVLGKSPKTANYTLCQLESFLTPNCSTRFDVSGIKGGRMTAHCEDPDDEDAYHRKYAMNPDPQRRKEQWGPRGDWRNVAHQMQLAVNLNGGEQNNNASNARLLTQLAVVPRDDGGPLGMPVLRPSMAEGLAVLFSSTLVMGAVDTPFGPDWQYDKPALGLPARQAFEASVRQQGYQSSHADRWQGVFYVVLAIVVVVNFVSLAFFVLSWRMRLTTDYSEPANLFAVALMSPPSHQFTGYCGSGVEGRALSVPWRVVGSPDHGGPGGADDDIDELCRPETDAEDSDATLGRGGNGNGNGNGNGGYAGASGFRPHQHQHPHMGMASGRDGPGGRPLHFYFRHAGNPVKGKWKGTEVGETPNLSAPQPTGTYQRLQNRKSWL